MERNVDKIKRLEHELGRWRKKVADTAKENEKLREALAQADVGNQETRPCGRCAHRCGAGARGAGHGPGCPGDGPGLAAGRPVLLRQGDAGEVRDTRPRGEDGKYILGVMERRSDL